MMSRERESQTIKPIVATNNYIRIILKDSKNKEKQNKIKKKC